MTEKEVMSLIHGASKLKDVYGYWISFHDAAVESVIVERVGPTVTIRFRTNDAVSTDGGETFNYEKDQLAHVVMRWHEVRDLTLTGVDWEENNWIGRMEFELQRDRVLTTVEQMDGPHGTILAERVEVLSVEPIERASVVDEPLKADRDVELVPDACRTVPEVCSPLVSQLRFSVQRALLGAVTPNLRGVTVGWGDGTIRLRFYYDGAISEEDEEQARCVGTEVIADFWSPWTIEEEIVRHDAPQPMERLAAWVYLRKEPDRL